MDELMAAMVLTSLSCSPLPCGPTHSQTAGTMTTNKQTTKLTLRNNKRQPRTKTGTITTKTLQTTNNNLVVVGVRVVIK